MQSITSNIDFNNIIRELKEASLKFIEDSEKIDFGLVWEAVKHIYVVNLKCIIVTMPLYYLSIITLPHASITRYPENDKSPLEIFTRKLAMVRKLPKLIEMGAFDEEG